jgi:hypothetical protein
MPDLKIKVFNGNDSLPKTTVTVPSAVLKIGSKLIPRQAMDALQKEGIDLGELMKLSEKPDVHGTVVKVEDHKKNQRVVITLE